MKKNQILTFFVLLFSLGAQPCFATWYNEAVPNGSDLVMMDVAWPWQPSATYYASWNSGFNPKPNNLSFYAGFVTLVREGEDFRPNTDSEVQQSFRPNSVWSFWGANEQGEPVRFLDVADNLYIKNEFGGEGLSGTVANVGGWDFIHPNENLKFNSKSHENRWYTMLSRVWQPDGEAHKLGRHAYMGRWIKDVRAGKWHFIGYVELPIPATSFHGNSGFIEPLTNPRAVRPLMRRFGYARKDGVWISTNRTHSINSRYVVVNVLPEDDHEYIAIEYSQRPEQIPMFLEGEPVTPDSGTVYTASQPDAPTLDVPKVADVHAVRYGNQALITWRLAESSSPQLGYTVEIFDNPECRGTPLDTQTRAWPTVTNALVACPKAGRAIRFTLRDVFDQNAEPITLYVKDIPQTEPVPTTVPVSVLKSGLNYQLFTKDVRYSKEYHLSPLQTPGETHAWLTLEEIADGELVREGVSRGLDPSVLDERTAGFALKYRGFLNVPATGMYLFDASIDGAYALRIGGKDVIVRNEQRGTRTHSGAITLAAGRHAFELTWLVDSLPTRNFSLRWTGPDFEMKSVTEADLLYDSSERVPETQITVQNSAPGQGRVEVRTSANGHDIQKTVLYLAGLELTHGAGSVTYEGPLPTGVNRFSARVYYDGNRTVDSTPSTLDIPPVPENESWTLSNIGPQDARFGVYPTARGTEGDAFSFFGNGMHAVTRDMTGDFTVSCRVDSWNGANGEPVNGQSWVGVAAFQNVKKLNWNWGATYYLVQRIRDRRTSPDYSDLGGSRVSNAAVPSRDLPWIRIQRAGNLLTSWVSAEGTDWQLVAAQLKPLPATMSVGLFFSSPAQHARAHYFANVSHLQVENEARLPFPTPQTATGTDAVRYTGVVTARSDANTFVVRTPVGQLLRTTDNGKTFETLAVSPSPIRSVAIHPENPEIMLCAVGSGTPESSGLLKTSDGGKSWQNLDFDGDFDGLGPSALCGEVVEFDLKNPEILYVGCESRGYFRSEDGGRTWSAPSLVGSRVTAVTQWRFEPYFPALGEGKTRLLITVCPDVWMKVLGRGEPKIKTECTISKVFHITGDQTPERARYETELTGFYNAQWDKQLPTIHEFTLGTSHGYVNNSGSPLSFYAESSNVEWLRPVTALGSSGRGEGRYGRFLTQALCPSDPTRLSRSETWALVWGFQKISGDVPTGGLISASPDWKDGEIWHFVFTDGLYVSTDGGRTLTRISATDIVPRVPLSEQ